MKNIEKYKNEITNHIKEYGDSLECTIANIAGIREEKCYPQDCEECQKKCIEWMYSEYKEEILSDDEKDIIKLMIDTILKFGCTVIDVRKIDIGNCDSFISIRYENPVIRTNDTLSSPIIDNDKFKGMKLNRKYTLEELGITCQTQKDNYVRQ